MTEQRDEIALTDDEKDSLGVGWCGPCEQGTLDVEDCRCAELLWPAVERIIAARLAPIVALHPKIEEPRHGCCAPPKLCTGHVPECGSRSHGVNRPAWPCADLRALSNPPADPKAGER